MLRWIKNFPLKVCSLPPSSKGINMKISSLKDKKKFNNFKTKSKNSKLISILLFFRKKTFNENLISIIKKNLTHLKNSKNLEILSVKICLNLKRKKLIVKSIKLKLWELKKLIINLNKDSNKSKNFIFMHKINMKIKDSMHPN